MPNEIKSFLKDNVLQITLQIVGLLVVILNMWLANKLLPMAKDIAIITNKVNAQEQTLTEHKNNNIEQFKSFSDWLVRVEGKLDRAIERK
jgi:hypothetical protein